MTDHSTRLLPRAAIVSDGGGEEPAVLAISGHDHTWQVALRCGRCPNQQRVSRLGESLEWAVPDIASP
jgi:hypothetical protein